MPEKHKIVVMIHCYNEEITIGNVVKEFQKYLIHDSSYVLSLLS